MITNPASIPGTVWHERWYESSQMARLGELARETHGLPGAVVEVGCWAGMSTIALASAISPTLLHAVDTWRGTQPDVTGVDPTARLAAERDIYAEFTDNLKAAGIRNVVAWPMDWRVFFAHWTGRIKFAHLDADHSTENTLALIQAVRPFLVPGGILAGDDWHMPTVQAAVNAAWLPGYQHENNLWFWRNAATT